MALETRDGFLLSREWQDEKKLQLIFWAKTSTGPLRIQFDNQQAVLFIERADLEKAETILTAGISYKKSSAYPQGKWQTRDLNLRTFNQAAISSIYFDQQSLLYRTRDLLKLQGITPLEADLQPTDRFLMERFITGGLTVHGDIQNTEGINSVLNPKIKASSFQPSFSVMSLDIETSMNGDHLYSIGMVSPNTDNKSASVERRVFMIGPNQAMQQVPDYLEFCKDENDLLQRFYNYFNDRNPDIIIGWNVINFDLRFLQCKAQQLKMPLRLGRNNALLHWRQSRNDNEHYTLQIPGRLVLDGIDTLKSATYNFESFSLQNVSRDLLNRGKLIHNVDNRGAEITRQFHSEKLTLAAYNLEDCQLVWDIFEKARLIDFAVERAQLTGLAMDRFGGSVAAFDNRYLPRLHRAGYIAPNIPEAPQGIGSPGGYVMDSLPGLYEDVLVLDFKSLYPSIIRTFKIDPMALIEGLKPSPPEPLKDQQETPDVDRTTLVPGYNGAVFSKSKNLLPDIIGELWEARDHAKQQSNSAMSQAIKILMNSFYGVLGTPGCRFFDSRLPSSITLRGHFILTHSKIFLEQQGHKIIYGDTDSVFVLLKKHDPQISVQAASAIGRALADQLNCWWQDFLKTQYQLTCFLEIEFETHFRKFVMPTIRGSEKGSKKRYSGLKVINNADGDNKKNLELIFKGLESVRTDWTLAAREFQRELYHRVFFDEDWQSFVLETISDIKQGKKDDQLVYRKRIRRHLDDYQKNIPPHVHAARIAEYEREKKHQPPVYLRGGWIQYVITTNGAEPLEYTQSMLDYDFYIEKQIEPIADGILQFIGSSFKEIADQQLGLF